jgi:hypothetical protein
MLDNIRLWLDNFFKSLQAKPGELADCSYIE